MSNGDYKGGGGAGNVPGQPYGGAAQAAPPAGYHWEYTTIHHDGYVLYPEESHMEHRLVKAARAVVMTPRSIPLATFVLAEGTEWNALKALSERQKAQGWVHAGTASSKTGKDSIGTYDELTEKYHNDKLWTLGTDERKGFSLPGLFG